LLSHFYGLAFGESSCGRCDAESLRDYRKKNNRSSEHLARTNEPEAKQEISNIFGMS
jgi:hypothetical protein